MYNPKYFDVKELVDEEVYNLLGENAIRLFDEDLLIAVDTLRETYGTAIIINNWHLGGNYSQRGFRSKKSKVGSEKSQHRFGRAFDLTIVGVSADTARQHILSNKDKYYGVNRMEDKVNWLHIDSKPIEQSERIQLFNP